MYKERWSAEDGLGAIVITPTRELAIQIFEVTFAFKAVAKSNKQNPDVLILQVFSTATAHHTALSVGMICGGKSFADEQIGVQRMSILIATPGRLIQHLRETPNFSLDELQVSFPLM